MSTSASSAGVQKRIASIQLDSKHADVAGNTDTVLNLVFQLISQRESRPIHLLVLPELALTGYVFKSRDEIEPLLEDARKFEPPKSHSPTSNSKQDTSQAISASFPEIRAKCLSSKQPSLNLAAHLAQQLDCHVVIGFPEIGSSQGITNKNLADVPFDARPTDVKDAEPLQQSDSEVGGVQDQAFNSAALLKPDGSIQHIFRKHFLFETDEVWASQGSGFEAVHLPLLGKVCVAICMDLNPFKFETPFNTCELASFCVERDVDLLVMPMAWLLPKDEREELSKVDGPRPSLSTINYWALRCQPLFDRDHPAHSTTTSSVVHDALVPHHSKARHLIATNRCGIEATSAFAGSSCVLEMKLGERPLLLDSLGRVQQSCLVVELPT